MGILCIQNRTENWKTALSFSPFFQVESRSHLVQTLALNPDYRPAYSKLELFWKGMRDHLYKCHEDKGEQAKDLSCRYRIHFSSATMNLRETVKNFECSRSSNFGSVSHTQNYYVEGYEKKLYSNLLNTEIDIVLETPEYLFIGEAKSEVDFGADGNLVLVHQLIRQYVMATLLVDRLAQKDSRCRREIVPFLVGQDKQALKEKCQVEFMMSQGWLDEARILSWEDIENLARIEK